MSTIDNATFFTVIIPTRNRPELFELALKSVLNQTFKQIDIIIVNDGSDPEYIPAYQALEEKYSDNARFVYQIKRPFGHGQSYSMNTGALVGTGKYICFLDDDDYWIDNEHLKRAFESIQSSKQQIDAYYSNQEAYFADGKKQTDTVWIEDLTKLAPIDKEDNKGNFVVDTDFMLRSQGFAHLNCSIIRRDLYLGIKGMDEGIRWECDRDIYLRTLDEANTIIYCPLIVSKHFIPDTKKSTNMTTAVSMLQKRLYQITVLEKAILLSKKPAIKKKAAEYLSFIYQHITATLLEENRQAEAAHYAKKSLAHRYSIKWHIYTVWLTITSWGQTL